MLVHTKFAFLQLTCFVHLNRAISIFPTQMYPTQYQPVAKTAYQWASAVGNQGHYSSTQAVAPFNLTASLAWIWQDPRGRYYGSPTGVVIDDQNNIYMTQLAGVHKFTADGKEMWKYKKDFAAEMTDSPTIADGKLYFASNDGVLHALSMETGEKIWSSHIARANDGTNGFVAAHAGMVVVSGNCDQTSDHEVIGINATTGQVRWSYRPDNNLWNFLASFPDDETVTFQDFYGKAYRISLNDGSLIWKNGGKPFTWTDGSGSVGPNGIFYAVNTELGGDKGPDAPGTLSAHRVADGETLWKTFTPRPPNNVPAIGRLVGHSGLSVVQPMGQQVLQGAPYDVRAYDAETGVEQWVFKGPSQKGRQQAGDAEGKPYRESVGLRGLTLPNPWSAPAIDGAGTVYVGNQEGQFYALRDLNGDGQVFGPSEVSEFNGGSCFSGSMGPAIAPGMVVVGSIDTMFVFKA